MGLYKVSFWNWRAENSIDFIIFDNEENAQQFISELKNSIRIEKVS
jgi:hypothetical protein